MELDYTDLDDMENEVLSLRKSSTETNDNEVLKGIAYDLSILAASAIYQLREYLE